MNTVKEVKNPAFLPYSKYVVDGTQKSNLIHKDLLYIKSWDTSFISFNFDSVYQESMQQCCDNLKVILNRSSLCIRWLSRSILLYDIANYIRSKRVFYGITIANLKSEEYLLYTNMTRHSVFLNLVLTQENYREILNTCDFSNCESIWIETHPNIQLDVFNEVLKLKKSTQTKIKMFVLLDFLSKEENQFYKLYPELIVEYSGEDYVGKLYKVY